MCSGRNRAARRRPLTRRCSLGRPVDVAGYGSVSEPGSRSSSMWRSRTATCSARRGVPLGLLPFGGAALFPPQQTKPLYPDLPFGGLVLSGGKNLATTQPTFDFRGLSLAGTLGGGIKNKNLPKKLGPPFPPPRILSLTHTLKNGT